MKYIKTFEDFVNESKENSDELNESGSNKGKGFKNANELWFKIWPRSKKSIEAGEDIHNITVGADENINDVKKKILSDYPRAKYYYELWKKAKGGYEKIETNESVDINETDQELNERERLRYVGTYRAKDGNTYKKWKDDENYISIQIGSTYVTIEGDGEIKSADEVMKEIIAAKEEAKANRFDPIRSMSNAEFKKHMRGY